MTMTPGLRKLALIVHLTVSVGWIGAVIAYLALVVAAMNSADAQMVSAALVAMKLIGWYVIVPMALASLVTGIIMALGTSWGLFRHYWVIFSLLLTVFAVVILLQHLHPVSFAGMAGVTHRASAAGLQSELLHAGVGLLVLLVVQVLNVYKPRGITPYGWRKQQEKRKAVQP
jgi:hypothetical protein